MAIVDDDMKDDSVYANLLESLNSNFGEGTPCSDDLAWATSCLNKGVDASVTDWSSIKDVLLDILSSHEGPVDSSGAESIAQSTADYYLHSTELITKLEFGKGSGEDEDLIDDFEKIELPDDDEDGLILRNKKVRVGRKGRIENVFLPNYTEDSEREGSSDSGMDPILTTWEVEQSSEDIFKVWDLGIPDEEDDFTQQLDKVLADVSAQIQPNSDDLTALEDLMPDPMDELLASIGDLSLK